MAGKKRQRRLFLEVDVWRRQFGTVSVTAIYDVFMQKFNVEKHNMNKYSFSHCVEELRKLEDPTYKEGDMALDILKTDVQYEEVIVEEEE